MTKSPIHRTRSMLARLFKPNPILVGYASGVRREPTRPVEFRVDNFRDKFDAETLFFDAFFTSRQNVLLVGPPFANLLPMLEEGIVTALPSGTLCAFQIRSMDRHSQMWVSVPDGTIQVVLECPLGRFEITPTDNLSNVFEGNRVLLTLSKNNHLHWIQDWVRFNRDIHGADAVLLYDNGSTAYSANYLLEALAKVSGLERILVVPWPFKYGPQGIGLLSYWDSDFCQPGAWEHARWMFLQRCYGVMNSDIDELVVCSNDATTFEAARRSWTGMVRYAGVWVVGNSCTEAPEVNGELVRHRDFLQYLSLGPIKRRSVVHPRGELNTKWTVVPSRCPRNAQWMAHSIYGWRGLYSYLSIDPNFCYRHFVRINDNWKDDRQERVRLEESSIIYDKWLAEAFARVDWDR